MLAQQRWPHVTTAGVVETTSGKVRGLSDRGLSIFKGIPYGATTAADARFLPPRKPVPWAGIRPALDYSPMAPQLPDREPPPAQKAAFTAMAAVFHGLWGAHNTQQSEDCLRLNVWTPGLGNGRPRPVMVWLHGGGFSTGGGDWGCTPGASLARENDVVVVSLNHRLSVFGFLYLGEVGGPGYAESGNVGMLDIVAALAWVRDNIGAFGGDPGNVTVFGQSGGGGKVITLMGMPAAKGLFHKAIVESGPYLRALSREAATRTTISLLVELGLSSSQVDRLQTLPAEALLAAMNRVLDPAASPYWLADWMTWDTMFAPVIDERTLFRHPFDPTASELCSSVPLLVGSTALELSSDGQTFGEDELARRMRFLAFSPEDTRDLVDAYRAPRPTATASDIFYAIASDKLVRMFSIRQGERKASQGTAAVYTYMFDFNPPAPGGRYKSPHAVELPFVFNNIDLVPGFFKEERPDASGYLLARNTSRAWGAFARSGNPNHAGLPHWAPYSLSRRETMILRSDAQMEDDPRGTDRIAMDRHFTAGWTL